ncbi:hypothetical protein ACJMK2_024017 [Sinanodonta woodiana]|uniref:Uncharacterized protein n=1 Tax=Sinanodonta woodiana TaxID=1069815 RepID=A0ABD3T630_SINWO
MGKKKTQGQGAERPLADRTQVQDDGMSYELETNTGVRYPVLELSESSGIVKEYTLDVRSPRRESELRRFGAAAMLQTKGDKSKYYGNTVTVNEDTGQYSIDLNECVAAARCLGAMKNIEILLQGMTTRTELAREDESC